MIYAQADYNRDLDSFSTLTAKHKNLFAHITKAQFDKQIEETRQRIKNPGLDREHFIIELMRINAQIADEHTILYPLSSSRFPLGFFVLDEGMVLMKSDSSHKQFLLNELVAIDNIPITEIIARFKTCIKTDNESYFKWFLAQYLSNQDLLKGFDVIQNQSSALFSFKNKNGEVNNVEVQTQPINTPLFTYAKQTKQLRYAQDRNYWFSLDRDRNILYFNYERCAEDDSLSFSKFNEELFKTIKKKKPSALVLDLRQNQGGDSRILSPFIERIKSSYLNAPNKFFVLIGRYTISSALMNAIQIKQNTSAIFIGEATGGNVNHYGEIRTFFLPEAKISGTYSTKYYEYWKDKPGAFLPDYDIPTSWNDLFEDKDSCLETVYRLYK